MKNNILILGVLLFFSCNKKETDSTLTKEDPNRYFTATFNGKTVKTAGFISAYAPLGLLKGSINSSNTLGIVETSMILNVSGSVLNSTFMSIHKIPAQEIDVYIDITKSGNTIGLYKPREHYIPGFYYSSIKDLTAGDKLYNLDPLTTSFNITSVDALYINGNYSGNLIDGTRKIPVSGTFKLSKN